MATDLLFSVTATDCDWNYFNGTGNGGQKRNKTASGVRCTHRASGAVGRSEESRSQHENKRIAFRRMAESDAFRAWHKRETARRTGVEAQAREAVEDGMNPRNIRVEVQHKGKWTDERLLDLQQESGG